MSEETATARVRYLEGELKRAEDELAGLRGLVVVLRAQLRDRGYVDDLELPEPDDLAAQHGRQIAYRIRAELVCCHIYEVQQQGREPSRREVVQLLSGNIHDICYWAEASAQIAENPSAWRGDPAVPEQRQEQQA